MLKLGMIIFDVASKYDTKLARCLGLMGLCYIWIDTNWSI